MHSGGLEVPKDKILNIRIDPELKKAAKKAADSDGRSLSNWVTWLIQRELKHSGKKSK
jgi:predicted HicB family RNase H-like nuclease